MDRQGVADRREEDDCRRQDEGDEDVVVQVKPARHSGVTVIS